MPTSICTRTTARRWSARRSLTGPFLSYDIQSSSELQTKATGLTIGHGASCVLVRREPFEGGCIRLRRIDTFSLPEHWALCQVPIDGHLSSSSTELMRSRNIVPRLAESLERVGWPAAGSRPLRVPPAE